MKKIKFFYISIENLVFFLIFPILLLSDIALFPNILSLNSFSGELASIFENWDWFVICVCGIMAWILLFAILLKDSSCFIATGLLHLFKNLLHWWLAFLCFCILKISAFSRCWLLCQKLTFSTCSCIPNAHSRWIIKDSLLFCNWDLGTELFIYFCRVITIWIKWRWNTSLLFRIINKPHLARIWRMVIPHF